MGGSAVPARAPPMPSLPALRLPRTALALVLGAALLPAAPSEETSNLGWYLDRARRALDQDRLPEAYELIQGALERDPKSLAAWRLRASWGAAADDADEQVFSLHRHRQLAEVQGASSRDLRDLTEELQALDPLAADLLGLKERFLDQLQPLADAYEKDDRPHSAIRVHKEILALDPQNEASQAAIERIASRPDPSLAGDAKPKDLLADVSEEWIAEFDAEHDTWSTKARLQRDNYVTYTDAGYEVLVRSAEAMEQMNAFYRVFFRYGTEEDGGSVPRINLHIFKDRDEYLEKGIGPPVEWSAGHFTGNAVETYIGNGGFEGMTTTLFHEAAHQFVSLATSASGWLNEGLASFFEGCRILSNGTVIMNLPANHRLFPLANRMEAGWMADAGDGIDPDNASATPRTAPTFRIVVENEYTWGPPWYAPTWGVVYFLYNYQDRVDGRFVYRDAFATYIDTSGGRRGEGAVENFEEVVLGNPSRPLPGEDYDEDLPLPEDIDALTEVWKDWMLELREIQSGRLEIDKPYLTWARNAVARGELDAAFEHYEKGLVAAPDDVELLEGFADFLAAERDDEDRAAKLMLAALREVESRDEVDTKLLRRLERQLGKWDPKRGKLARIHEDIEARALSVAERYLAAGRPLVAMDVAWRLGDALDMPELFDVYRRALELSGKSLWIWSLAYNERDLEGWVTAGKPAFQPNGSFLDADFDSANPYDYQFLALDTVTSGDFSLEARVQVNKDEVGFAGLVFGKKSDTTFHALILYPPHDSRAGDEVIEQPSFVDLTTFYSSDDFRIWRHVPVASKLEEGSSATGEWHEVRLDVVGRDVDVWIDGEFSSSQSFPDRDVLRGSFGLLTAPGKARFRDVRYLARPARDPGAEVERRLRFEAIEAAGGEVGGLSGSFLGLEPPLPKERRWLSEPFPGWDEEQAPAVTLVTLWSIQQNDLIPLQGWLTDLERRWGDKGLRLLSIGSALDDDAIDGYLADKPWPGYQCVDELADGGIGLTFTDYSIDRFNLPRTLLVDIDGRVVWEGDPGFRFGDPWRSGMATYLDSPLRELMEERDLEALSAWHRRWETTLTDIRAGRFTDALPVLAEADAFDASVDKAVGRAQAMRAAVRRAAEDPVAVAEELAGRGAHPAIHALVAWGEALGVTYEAKVEKPLKRMLREDAYRAWDKVATECRRAVLMVGTEREAERLDELEADLAGLEGPMVAALLEDLRAARAAGDDLAALLEAAPDRPARWLAERYFAW